MGHDGVHLLYPLVTQKVIVFDSGSSLKSRATNINYGEIEATGVHALKF